MHFLFGLMMLLSPQSGKGNYHQQFEADYDSAVQFNLSHSKEIADVCRKHQVNVNWFKAIIFPELIRYSSYSDFLETEALGWLYVEGGSKSADFSIGHLQMKPSFVERLEEYVSSGGEPLSKEYGFITVYDSGSTVRKQRLERMKDFGWQLNYLSCFIEVVQHRFSKLQSPSEEITVKFLASAYNTGFHKSPEFILSNITSIQFPYGSKFKTGNKCSYAMLSWDYYSNYLKK